MKFDTLFKLGIIGTLLGAVIYLACIVTIVYVAFHFISKLW